jgi:MFS family permease
MMKEDIAENNTEPGAHSNRVLLATLSLGHMVNDWVAGTIWIIAPAIAASMGLGPTEVGWILTINGIAAGLMYIPAGILSDRISNQGLLLIVTFWWVAIGYFCATLASGFWAITLLLGLGIMGDAFWHPVATGVLVKRMPARRAQVLGIHAMGGSVGAEILGPLSAGLLLGFFDWRTTMQLLVIPAVIMGILFIPIARGFSIVPKSRSSSSDLMMLIKDWCTPAGLILVTMMIFYNMSLFGIFAMTPLILQTKYSLTPFIAAVVFASMLVVGTLFQPFTGKLSDRVGRKPVILSVMLVAACSALLAGVFSSFWAFVTALVITTSLLTAVRPVILAAAVEFSGKAESTALGLVFSILDGVGAVGALVAGYAGEINLSYAYLLAAAMAFISIGLTATLTFDKVKYH